MKKTNNPTVPTRYPFDYCVKNYDKFALLVKDNISALQQLIAKNEHLLKLNEISANKQVLEINRQYGYAISRQTYSSMKKGKLAFCSNIVERLIAAYWGLRPEELRELDTSLPCDIKPAA